MADLLIRCDQDIDLALWLHLLLLQILCITEQYAGTQLIIQKAALDVPAFGHDRTRIKADKITCHDAKLSDILR